MHLSSMTKVRAVLFLINLRVHDLNSAHLGVLAYAFGVATRIILLRCEILQESAHLRTLGNM